MLDGKGGELAAKGLVRARDGERELSQITKEEPEPFFCHRNRVLRFELFSQGTLSRIHGTFQRAAKTILVLRGMEGWRRSLQTRARVVEPTITTTAKLFAKPPAFLSSLSRLTCQRGVNFGDRFAQTGPVLAEQQLRRPLKEPVAKSFGDETFSLKPFGI